MSEAMKGKTNATILVVDDMPANLHLLAGMLKQEGYHVRVAPNASMALKSIENNQPDLMLVDITMPGMNGYELCKIIKDDPRWSSIPVIFISALNASLDKVRAFEVGGVDYVAKPFDFHEVQARVATHLELARYRHSLEELVKEQTKEIYAAQMATVYSLAKLAESRDNDMEFHLERIGLVSELLAVQLRANPKYTHLINDTFISNVYHASPLHDIGKVAIPDAILCKPGRLDVDEMSIMKTHSAIGAETMQVAQQRYGHNEFINMGIDIARSHHEKWDGSGYPDGLVGEGIPLSARIVAVADVYDALRSKRCYKESFYRTESKEIIEQGAGKHFDPEIVKAFLDCEEHIETIYKKMMEV